jgi:hypothetical protein
MAEYRYKAPDGEVHMFRGPEGLNEHDVELFGNNYFGVDTRPKLTPPPEPKPEGGFIPSVRRGFAQTGMLLGDVLPAMAAHAVGAEDYAKKQWQEAAETEKDIQKRFPAEVPSYKDIKDIGTGFKYIVESVGESIPSILPSLFTGGAASIIGRGAIAAAKAAAEDVVLKGAATGISEQALKEQAMAAGLKAARERGKKGGRKKTLASDPKVLTAKKMYQNHKMSINNICNILKISRATFYRYIAIPDKDISLA